MVQDRLFGWILSAGLHALLLLGATLVAVETFGVGIPAEEVYIVTGLGMNSSEPLDPQVIIREVSEPQHGEVKNPFPTSEKVDLSRPEMFQNCAWNNGCKGCEKESWTGIPCPVCKPGLSKKSAPWGVGRRGSINWPPERLCGNDLLDRGIPFER